MLSTILIVLLILLLIGEASARRPAAEGPAVATAATRKRLASNVRHPDSVHSPNRSVGMELCFPAVIMRR